MLLFPDLGMLMFEGALVSCPCGSVLLLGAVISLGWGPRAALGSFSHLAASSGL